MTRLAVAFALLPALASAEQSKRVWESPHSWGSPAVIEMHAPTHPDAEATVTFHNEQVHEGNEEFSLTFDGLTVKIFFEWNVDEHGSERVTIMPPDGYLSIPAEITVPEHDSGEIQIVPWRGG